MLWRRNWFLPAAVLIAWGVGCANRNDAPGEGRETSATAATTAPREKSVKPGINDSYKNLESVETWVQRFEVESREIYRERRRIVETLGLEPGDTIADIGAGTGLFEKLFSEAVGPRGRVFAVDITPKFIQHINERARKFGLANVQTVLCKEDSVELPPNSVDVAFICDVYHHFEYPKSSTSSIHRALKPGGRLVVIDFERVEGTSRDWILGHVRAGKDVVVSEIIAQGFELTDDGSKTDFLSENYIIQFRKPG